jgi:ketosteroid isomerase-like protein
VHPNAALVESLYAALARRDGAAMAACYAEDAAFSDPVFDLRGREIGAMWTMLCARGKDLAVEWHGVLADDARGRAEWDARYTFAGTRRKVHNRIASEFIFANGRIMTQRDTFDFRRWARMALGFTAGMPFMTPLVRRAVQRQARRALDDWIDVHQGALPRDA